MLPDARERVEAEEAQRAVRVKKTG